MSVADRGVHDSPRPYFLFEEKQQQLQLLIANPLPGEDEYADASQFL